MPSNLHLNALESAIFRERTNIVNIEIGLFTLALAGAALGTDAPQTYALLAMLFVMLFMSYRLRTFDRVYKLWREVKHDLVQAKNVWKFFPLFNVAWFFLALVAAGVLSKNGLFGVLPW